MNFFSDKQCAKCPLHCSWDHKPAEPKWHRNTPLKYLFISGESPDSGYKPFFESLIEKSEIDVDDCMFTHSTMCVALGYDGRPRTVEPHEVSICIPHAINEIRRFRPLLAVSIGPSPLVALNKPKSKIKATTVHGDFYDMKLSVDERYFAYQSWLDDFKKRGEFDNHLVRVETSEPDMEIQIERAKEVTGYDENWLKTKVMPVVHTTFAKKKGEDGGWAWSIVLDLQNASRLFDHDAVHKAPEKDYRWINNVDEMESHIDFLIDSFKSGKIGPVAVDIETSEEKGEAGKIGLIPVSPVNRILTIQFTHENNTGVTLMVNHRESEFNEPVAFARLVRAMERFFAEVDVIGQNFTFDAKAIRCRLGIRDFRLVGDTMLMSHWLDAGKGLSSGLDQLGAMLLGTGRHKSESRDWRDKNPGLTFEDMPLSLSLDYASGDTDVTFQCYHVLKKRIEEEGRWDQYFAYHHGVHGVWDVVTELEWAGMPVDKEILDRLNEDYPKRISASLNKLHGNPFVLGFVERGRLEHNVKVEKENEGKRILNVEIQKERDWIDAERKAKRKPGKRKRILKKFKETCPEINEWMRDRDKWYNPGSWEQTLLLWKEIAQFPWDKIHGIEYKDVQGKGSNKIGEIPKTNKHNRKILREFCGGLVKAAERVGQDATAWSLLVEMMELLDEFKTVSKMFSSYVKGIYPLIPDKPEPDEPWSPSDRCFKLYEKFCDFPPPWVLHPSYHLAGTETGRLSSSDPNGQAFPKKNLDKKGNVKLPYISRWRGEGGLIVQPDYSQLEVRVLVMLSGEKLMADAINKGEDIHRFVASLSNNCRLDQVTEEMRASAKTVTFGIIYGQGIPAMAQILGIHPREAQKIQDDVFARFPNLKKFIDARHQELRQFGKVLSPIGRVRYIPSIGSGKTGEVNAALREGVNTPIQGAGSDLCSQAFGRVWKRFRASRMSENVLPFSIIHDSQSFDVAPGRFFDVMEAQYFEMVWAPYTFYDWITVIPQADFDLGAGWGRLISAGLVFDDNGNFDHNRLQMTGDKDNIFAVIDEINSGGGECKIERDGLHHAEEESKKGVHETHIFVNRPDPIFICQDKKLFEKDPSTGKLVLLAE